MDPRLLDPAQWDQIARAMLHFYAFVALALTSALAFLLGRVAIPATVDDTAWQGRARTVRRVVHPGIFAAALLLALYAFGRGLALAVGVIEDFFPRFLI